MSVDARGHIGESEQLRYVDGELDESDLEALEGHLSTCLACRDAVDDLAAASDSLTAFLNQTDFDARPLTYRGARQRAWWAGPGGIAAGLVLLLGGAFVPVRMLVTPRADPPQADTAMISDLELADALADALPGPLARGLEQDTQPVVPVTAHPDSRSVVVVADGRAAAGVSVVPLTDGVPLESFVIEVTSWQAGGALVLVFEDTDVYSYRNLDGGRSTWSIDTRRGRIVIDTHAASNSSHEVKIPRELRQQIVVRIAGQDHRFITTAGGVEPGQRIFIQLDESARR